MNMRPDIEFVPALGLTLPAPKPMALPTLSFAYGAADLAARHCGLSLTPPFLRGRWQHGWAMPQRQFHPRALFGESVGSQPGERLWVARKDEEDYLRSQGLRARAVGLPVVYVPRPDVKRRPGTLLVMPIHSVGYTTHRWPMEEYADQVEAIRKDFDEVLVCVHPSCWEHGYWVPQFQRRGFTLIRGAHGEDRNGLRRVAALLSAVEFVTTNGMGSHLAYGAYFGAKVSVYGIYAEEKPEDLRNAPFYQENPHLMGPILKAQSEAALRRAYLWLFCHPREAVVRTTWGEEQVGHANKPSPATLRRLFGWSLLQRAGRAARHCAMHGVRVALSEPAKAVIKSVLRPEYRELRRLAALPRYTPTETSLLGKPFHLNDALAFVNAYEQIFRREIYRFVTTRDAPLIIDGGANVGLATIWFKRHYPSARVLAFEADPDVFAILKANCEALSPDAGLIPKALWTAETTLRFRPEGVGAGRLLPDGGAGPEVVEVPTVRLRDFLDQEVDLLKLDVEGVETELLEDCKDLLGNIRNLFVEYHSFVGRTQTLDRLLAVLREAGFRVHVHSPSEAPSPLVSRPVYLGMDLQLNVFAYR
jgi:FkbM family methyltransferase